MQDSGLTVFYRTVDGRKEIYVSGFFSSACASLDPDGSHVEITASRWACDTRYGIRENKYALAPCGLLKDGRDGWEVVGIGGLGEEDVHFLGLALKGIEQASPEEEPYISLRKRAVDALAPICRPQPAQTS